MRPAVDLPQGELFEPAWPEGLRFEPEFLSRTDERRLLDWVAGLPLRAAQYKGYEARRRVASFGGSYDFDALRLKAAPAVPAELHDVRAAAAAWAGLPASALGHALVAEYAPGTPLGWHRDVPDYEDVIGISLAADARMKLRPWPPRRGDAVLELALPPRSIYLLRGAARWQWQHSIPATTALRYSITLRSLRA